MVYRNYNLAKEWVRSGYKVTIISASYSHSRSCQPDVSKNNGHDQIGGIEYIWFSVPKYNPSKRVGRVFAMLVFNLRVMLSSLWNKYNYNIVVASSPNPFSIFPAYLISRKCNAHLVYDIRDLWPLTLCQLGEVSEKHPFIMAMQAAEDFACKKSDLVLSVPKNSKEYLVSRGMHPSKFMYLPNGISQDEDVMEPLPSYHLEKLNKIKEEGCTVVGYCGAIGLANALQFLIQAVHLLKGSNIHVVIMGHGPYEENLKMLSHELSVKDKISFLSPVPRPAVSDFLSRIDIAYIGLVDVPIFSMGVSPTKLNDYMHAGKPIVYSVGDEDNPVSASGCGVCCKPGSAKNVAEGILSIDSLDDSSRREMGRRGRDWLDQNMDITKHASQVLDRLIS